MRKCGSQQQAAVGRPPRPTDTAPAARRCGMSAASRRSFGHWYLRALHCAADHMKEVPRFKTEQEYAALAQGKPF
eukprot:3893876-Alexandrium_andersonii.AAC.1